MPKKKIPVIVGIIVVILIALSFYFFQRSKTSSSIQSPVGSSPGNKLPASEKLKLTEWKDPLGFSFSYPQDVKINPHDEDQENYAHVELTSVKHPGNLVIWAKDTEFASMDDWTKGDQMATISSTLDTTLSQAPAKKFYTKNPKLLVTGSIYDQLLFIIEGSTDTYWESIYNEVTKSFSFGTVSGQEQKITQESPEDYSGEESEGDISEGEEVVE